MKRPREGDMELGWYVAALVYPVIILGVIYLAYRASSAGDAG